MPASKEIVIHGVRISYIENIVDDTLPVTVFLHGWASSKESFHLLFPCAANYIAFDFPNCGSSAPLSKEYTLGDYVDVYAGFIDKKCARKKCNIVAHSFGGRVFLKWFAGGNTTNIENIIFTGVPFYRRLSLFQKMQYSVSQILNTKLFSWSKPFVQKMYSYISASSDYTDLAGNIVLQKTFQNIIEEDVSVHLSLLQDEKVHMIWGEKDDAAPIYNMKNAHDVLPESSMHTIKNAGHFPWADSTKEYTKILSFIIS